ncbi:MAG: restriction endonuclease [Chitinivorax sp.]|jgi:restriction system protein
MAIPDYQSCMLPLLKLVADGNDHSLREVVDLLAGVFQLTEAERAELLPSGGQQVFHNRIGWARSYLKKAGLLDAPRRGVFRITPRGLDVLARQPVRIDVRFLEQFPEFVQFREGSRKEGAELPALPQEESDGTPEEMLELAHQKIRSELAQELINRILLCSPAFFESLVVELLVKMGYGGSRKDAGERIGQSGDGGIDGIIKEDRLGLDVIYLQAKRWQGSVGRPEIQKFVGALQGQRARKGVFITTSGFTADAVDYVSRVDTKVVLIDGSLLANLMIDFDVGVSVAAAYTVKKIDSDYFDVP